jgi:type IV secretory pathway VirB6-like protein
MYPYSHPYHYHNDTSDEDEERDVLCGCSRYEYCACDDNNSTQYFDELIGNGSYDALNKSIVNVAEVNGTMTILINGTLPNDTALPDEDASENGALSRRQEFPTIRFHENASKGIMGIVIAAIVLSAL